MKNRLCFLFCESSPMRVEFTEKKKIQASCWRPDKRTHSEQQ